MGVARVFLLAATLLAVSDFVGSSRLPKYHCPSGFGYYFHGNNGRSCYKLVKRQSAWMEAKRYCQSFGGDLVSIESQREQLHVKWIIDRNPGFAVPNRHNSYWTSGADIKREGFWLWTSTHQSVRYTNWGFNQPNGKDAENCLALSHGDRCRWHDYPCHYDFLGTVCEKKV